MDYRYTTSVRTDDALRRSFNELTRRTFGFDFVNWYEAGHWGELYIPHVLLDGDRVVSNVSVNRIKFIVGGVEKNYIQLGTVMTAPAYRGRGLNRAIMERVLGEYAGADGIYLFGNDSVLDYYPKFGFRPSREYEYYLPCPSAGAVRPYVVEKLDWTQAAQRERLYTAIRSCGLNPNDGMYMSENLGLYQFWLAAGYGDQVYCLPENGAYAIAEIEGRTLRIHQVIGNRPLDVRRLAKSFGDTVEELVLGYTPAQRETFLVREHREEDCTLFILGEDLARLERDKMMFPLLSHA